MKQTIMVGINNKLEEYPVGEKDYHLGDRFARLGYRGSFAIAMAEIGLDPMVEGKVYAYVLNRNPRYRAPYYGWALDRMEFPTDNVASCARRCEQALDYARRIYGVAADGSVNQPDWG